MDSTDNDALLEVNRMELRSGRNLLKLAADSTEVDGTSTTPKEKMQTPRRKSVNSKRNIENKTENEELVGEPQSRKSTQRKTNSRKSKLEEENEGGTSATSKEKIQTPRRKSVDRKMSMGKGKENEEPDESQSRKSTQRKVNKRKSRLEEENEVAETSPLVENAQTPNITLSQMKKRRKSMPILTEDEGHSTTSQENTRTPTRKSINIKRSIGKEKEYEEPAIPFVSVDESQSRRSSQRKRKSSFEKENEVGTSTTSKENMQTPRRKSVNSKRSMGKEKENEEPDVTFNTAEESPGTKSGQRKTNKRKSMLEEENEVAETIPLVGNAQSPHEKVSQSKKRRKSMHIVEEQPTITCITIEESSSKEASQTKINRRKSMNEEHEVVTACTSVEDTSGRKSSEIKINRRKSKQEEEIVASEFVDLVSPAQECEIISSHGIGNVEKNDEVSASTGDQNEEDVAEILNSTFEVAEEDTFIQTPARKRSVRFVDAVETRRQTVSVDNSPKTPVSVNSKQRCSHYKGTPHPSANKRPASILKNSSSKNFPSNSKDNSLRGTGSVRKMPDFGSIHKAQFEKMESIVDFSHRRHKCVRKLETQATDDSNKQVQATDDSNKQVQATDDSNKQVQLKPSAIVKPIEQTTRNTLSRIPVVPQNTSRSGTPRALSSSHISLASFRVLTEKNIDARRNTPHKINSMPSLKNFDSRRSTPQAINSRASSTKIVNNSRPKPVTNPKLPRVTYEQAKAAIQNKKPLTAAKREAERLENRNLLKGVRLNRRFELQMQHRKLNM